MNLQIDFHGVDHSQALEENIRKEVARLERFFDKILSCRVVIEKPHRRKGEALAINVHLKLPKHREINVTRGPDGHQSNRDPFVALRNAFRSVGRAVQDDARKLRGDIKSHSRKASRRATEPS